MEHGIKELVWSSPTADQLRTLILETNIFTLFGVTSLLLMVSLRVVFAPRHLRATCGITNVEQDQNYATSSGSASEIFRSVQRCKGYTGDNTEDPTGVRRAISRIIHKHESLACSAVVVYVDVGVGFSA